jgi:transcriptional regulator with XRE-family HTH domain
MEIGQRIKQLRTQNKLTLEELASRCELSKGFISQVERDLTSPSIATLSDIVEALGINLAQFFKEEREEKLVFTQEDFFIDEKEECTIHWIVPNAQKNDMEPILLDLKPGQKSDIISPHNGEEFGYVLNGKVSLVINNKKYVVKKGQTFYIKGLHDHYILNDTKSDAKVLWVCNPPIF